MSSLRSIFLVYATVLKRKWKVLVIFSAIISIIVAAFFLYYLGQPDELKPPPNYLIPQIFGFTELFVIIMLITLFAGIICSEFYEKTGNIIFPKIGRFKLIIGKFLGNLTIAYTVIIIQYIVFGYYSSLVDYPKHDNFLEAMGDDFYLSLGISLLVVAAIASFITFLSSVLRNISIVSVFAFALLMVIFPILDLVVVMIIGRSLGTLYEPLYSLDYLSNLSTAVLVMDFPLTYDQRFSGFGWITPSIETGIATLIFYISNCLAFGIIILNRRDLKS